MRVQVGDTAGREVDPVATEEPLAGGTLGQLPHERASFDTGGADVRLVRGDVVDDVIARPRLDTVRVIGEPEDQ